MTTLYLDETTHNELSMNRLYKVTITEDPDDGRYIADVPTLSPCTTWGETLGEALSMVKEAIEGVIQSREANGYPINDDTEQLQQESQRPIQTVVKLPVDDSYQTLSA